MKKRYYTPMQYAWMLFLLCYFENASAQTSFIIQEKLVIPDYPLYHDDRAQGEHEHNDHENYENNQNYQPLVVYIPVSTLPNQLDSVFGLEKVIISATHNRVSDLKMELISPDSTLVWLSNRNGKFDRNYDSTRFAQRGFNGAISNAKAPFNGDFQPDGNLTLFNNGQNPNGFWRFVVYDLAHDSLGSIDRVALVFSQNPATQRLSPCSVEHVEQCICSRPDGRLLPDLVISANGTADNIWEVSYDPEIGYGLLMFEVRVMNLGEGPLELEGTNVWLCGQDTVSDRHIACKNSMSVTDDSIYPRQIFRQNIYKIENHKMLKTNRLAGTMAFDAHPGHEHFHADHYGRFTLLEVDAAEPDTNKWRTVGTVRKASFCLWDMQYCDQTNGKCDLKGQIFDEHNLPNYGFGQYHSCMDAERQGISVGGIDWYGLHYDGQNLRLPKDTKNGQYMLKIEIDPFNVYEESDETNNNLFLPVTLRWQEYNKNEPHEHQTNINLTKTRQH